MLLRALRLLLIFALFHHAVALPGVPQAGVAAEAAGEHAVMHWQNQAHHHHDDGRVHAHEGAASSQHLHLDCGLHCPALMPVAADLLLLAPDHRPVAACGDAAPDSACLKHPDRPPRLPGR